MLANAFLLLLGSTLVSLRLTAQSGSFPRPLTVAEERELLRLSSSGDISSRNKLIEHNLRLVAHIIKKYYVSESDQDDLISIGTIGLIKGITTFNQDKGVRLATYASRCIENEILMYFRSARKSASDISLSDAIETDGDGAELPIQDVLADDTDITEAICDRELCRHLPEYMNRVLDSKEKAVLYLRYGLGDHKPLTQKETAKRMQISRSYVSRIEKRALEKLKKTITKED